MKKRIQPVMLTLAVIAAAIMSLGHFQELPQGYTGAPGEMDCNVCHNNPLPAMSGGMVLTGLPTFAVSGQAYPVTMIVYTDNNVAQTAGFQLTLLNNDGTSNGELAIAGPNVDVQTFGNRQYVQHGPGVHFFQGNVADEVEFSFTWTPGNVSQPTAVQGWSAAILGNGNYMSAGGFRQDSMILGAYSTTIVPALLAEITGISSPLCHGDANGSLEVQFAGGLAPVQIEWSNGFTTPVISDLAAGEYTVTVSDAAGQVIVLSHDLDQPDELEGAVEPASPSCHDSADGSIFVLFAGGTPPYTVLIDGEPSPNPATGLDEGSYFLEITDQHGCFLMLGEVALTAPQPISVVIEEMQHETSTEGGFIIIAVDGGTPPYSFSWEGAEHQYSSTVQNPANLESGTYLLTVTDANGCEEYLTVEIEFISSINNAGTVWTGALLSPNPGVSSLHITWPAALTPQWEVMAYTTDGQRIWNEFISDRYASTHHDMQTWKSGHYLILLRHVPTGSAKMVSWVKL